MASIAQKAPTVPRQPIIALLLVALSVAAGLRTTAHDSAPTVTPIRASTPTAASAHPMVGSWSETRNGGSHATFFADGHVILTDEYGQTWHGAWRPVDAHGIIATYTIQSGGTAGGQGIEDAAHGITGDQLTLGLGTFIRLVPPQSRRLA